MPGISEYLLSLAQRVRVVRSDERINPLNGAVDRHEVQPAVVVDVEPGCPEASVGEGRIGKAGDRAAGFESSRPVIDIEIVTLAREIRHEDIFVPVIVEIASVDAHTRLRLAVFAERGAGEQAYVFERAVALVDPKLVRVTIIGNVNRPSRRR